MAVINNLNATLSQFKINDQSSQLVNNIGTYGTTEILNGGELLENVITYTFTISGLKNHTIQSISFESLLLTEEGELNTTKNLSTRILNYSSPFTGNFITSDSKKTILTTTFKETKPIEDDIFEFTLQVSMNSLESCYFGLHGIIIDLLDIPNSVKLYFSGPNTGRRPSSINVSTLVTTKGAVNVTFSKDESIQFDKEQDNVDGRIYFRHDGIYVDGYQYGVNVEASESKIGLVKLKNDYEINPEGGIIIDNQSGIAATPQLIINTLNKITNFIDNGIIPPADTESFGFVKLRDSFETFVDEETGETGIVIPNENGVAASTLLVYNTINTLKTYTDELVEGIPIPSIELEDNTIEQIKEDYIFSNDFERDADNKIYIKWLEIN